MKPKTKRLACRALSWLLTASIILGIISVGGFTIYAAELAGYENETVVRFRNAGSGKYLNVHNGIDANGTNVYQWTYDGSDEQTFRIKYNREKDCYTIGPMCCNNGYGRVLDIVKSGGEVVAGCNVQIYSPVDAKAQEWQFEYYGGGAFAIHPTANIYAYLTAYNNENGTAGGTSATSLGNVYLTEHPMSSSTEPANYQLWFIEEVEYNRTINDGYYKLKNNYGNKYMTAQTTFYDAYQAAGRNAMDQIWHVEYLFNGYYSIRSAEDAKYAVRVHYTDDEEYDEMGVYIDLAGLNSSQSMVLNNAMMWKIIPNAGENTYRMVAKCSYDNQVVTALSDNDNSTLYAQVPYVDADTQKWTFATAQCPKQGQTEHAKGHCLELKKDTYDSVWYECAICDAYFKTPQEQDHENSALSDEDRVTIYALQNAAVQFQLEGKNHFVEACLRAADVIRAQYNGLYTYDFSDASGNYYSPIEYTHNANSINVGINVSTITRDEMRYMEQEILWTLGRMLPYPLDVAAEAIENYAKTGEWYTHSELIVLALIGLANEGMEHLVPNLVNPENKKDLIKCITAANISNAIIEYTIPPEYFENEIILEITVQDDTYVTYIRGTYHMDNTSLNRMYVLNEEFDANYLSSGNYTDNTLMIEYDRDGRHSRDGWTLF